MAYQYILEPYSGIKSRHSCPACGKAKMLTLYIDGETRQPLHQTVGRCNRETNCGYHYKPKDYFKEHGSIRQVAPGQPWHPLGKGGLPPVPQPNKAMEASLPYRNGHASPRGHVGNRQPHSPDTAGTHTAASFIPYKFFSPSLQFFESENYFLQYLQTRFSRESIEKALMDYFVGNVNHWRGATVFWQIDKDANIRTGKIMLFDAQSGHRVKEPFNHISWVHKLLEIPDYNLKQCLFGEHLLAVYPQKPVALVESEKTAFIASMCLPKFNWMAAGSLQNLSAEKCLPLVDQNVTLYPDTNAYNIWRQKARQLPIENMTVSDLLETNATPEQKAKGYDIADYLMDLIPELPPC